MGQITCNRIITICEGIEGTFLIAFILLTPFLRSRHSRWGATDAEIQQSLPGDDLVPNSRGGYTHAITVRASTAAVWPWLAQIGQGRGGFYSYELLENMAGCQIHNADRILSKFQQLEIGDMIGMHPKMGNPYKVNSIEPGRALVLLLREKTQIGSWAFFLEELDANTSRLISRSRNDYSRSLGNTLAFAILGPISIVMDRKMLLGIKKRAEGAKQA